MPISPIRNMFLDLGSQDPMGRMNRRFGQSPQGTPNPIAMRVLEAQRAAQSAPSPDLGAVMLRQQKRGVLESSKAQAMQAMQGDGSGGWADVMRSVLAGLQNNYVDKRLAEQGGTGPLEAQQQLRDRERLQDRADRLQSAESQYDMQRGLQDAEHSNRRDLAKLGYEQDVKLANLGEAFYRARQEAASSDASMKDQISLIKLENEMEKALFEREEAIRAREENVPPQIHEEMERIADPIYDAVSDRSKLQSAMFSYQKQVDILKQLVEAGGDQTTLTRILREKGMLTKTKNVSDLEQATQLWAAATADEFMGILEGFTGAISNYEIDVARSMILNPNMTVENATKILDDITREYQHYDGFLENVSQKGLMPTDFWKKNNAQFRSGDYLQAVDGEVDAALARSLPELRDPDGNLDLTRALRPQAVNRMEELAGGSSIVGFTPLQIGSMIDLLDSDRQAEVESNIAQLMQQGDEQGLREYLRGVASIANELRNAGPSEQVKEAMNPGSNYAIKPGWLR